MNKFKQPPRQKTILSIFFMFILLFTQVIPVYASTATLPSGTAYTDIGTEIENYVEENIETTAGMEVSIFHENDTIYQNYFGYADIENQIATDENTVMEWGSATKILVWVSAMQLWEQGKLNLDMDVRTYLPEGFLDDLEYDTPITMIDLMNHRAGFQEVYSGLFIQEHDSISSLADSLQAHIPPQIFEPDTITAYSNWGTGLAAYVIECISGVCFDDYVHKNIFEPLGMKHSALSPDLSDNKWVQEKRTALQCYEADGSLIPDCFYYLTVYPAGMCTSTLHDFELFAKALLNENSPLFAKEETWNTLFTPTCYLGDSGVPSNYHGLWVSPYGVETIGHGGNSTGCSSYLLLDIENKIGVVVMTNQAHETIYNKDMMELIFGKFSEELYFEEERVAPEGIYHLARSVHVGPFKINDFDFRFTKMESNEFWATSSESGADIIYCTDSDLIRVSALEVTSGVVLVLFYGIALFVSVISLIVKLIRKIIYTCMKKPLLIPMGKWSTLSSILQITSCILFCVMAVQAISYALPSTYIWALVAFTPIAIAMIGCIIYGIKLFPKCQATKIRKFYHILTIILLITTVINILYWNVFMWWEV